MVESEIWNAGLEDQSGHQPVSLTTQAWPAAELEGVLVPNSGGSCCCCGSVSKCLASSLELLMVSRSSKGKELSGYKWKEKGKELKAADIRE